MIKVEIKPCGHTAESGVKKTIKILGMTILTKIVIPLRVNNDDYYEFINRL